jgi:hypothetical protein
MSETTLILKSELIEKRRLIMKSELVMEIEFMILRLMKRRRRNKEKTHDLRGYITRTGITIKIRFENRRKLMAPHKAH